MEKFTQWRDRGTGIAPFSPILATPTVRGYLGCIIRCIVFGLSVLTGWFGWIPIDFRAANVSSNKPLKGKDLGLKPGTAVIVNYTCPLDGYMTIAALRLAGADNIVLAIPHEDKSVSEVTAFGMLTEALSLPRTDPGSLDIETFIDQTEERKAVCAIFVEGTTSNGRAILPFMLPLIKITTRAKNPPLALALTYRPGNITTPLPRMFVSWLWTFCTSSKISVRARLSAPVSEPEDLAAALENAGRLKRVGPQLNIDSKRKFIKAYNARR
ncbi:hypothetical protein CANCADRAFT_1053 [Tortispora caseinolytica NRRL Y-17796]|uniref:Phospholipid/glycerol acyltransferase domain-containing protein n=1 Tax=Tortispora caseinolytica NRRL Y-17796 TaxID=767744 RepID=A0A1E4TL45_9ASCO|nr:hypothetical protein CANCADRAFT_1053 [Tortispora caseinolytica NRRL Y-17796]